MKNLALIAEAIQLPATFPESEIGLLTLDEFHQLRNSEDKYHDSDLFTETLTVKEDIFPAKDMIRLEKLTRTKKVDPYGELKALLIEMAEGKDWDER